MNRVKVLRASAGSGKTYRLTYDFIKSLIEQPYSYQSILAVTFTNKATEQMKSRILEQLHVLATGRSVYADDLLRDTALPLATIQRNALRARGLILHDYSSFSVTTIDKFFQRIVRGFFKELGLDFGYTIELEQDSHLGQAVDRLLERSASDGTLSDILNRAIEDKLDNQKNWDIRSSLIKMGGELYRENYVPNAVPPEQAITFFDSIRQSIETQIEELRLTCGKVLEAIDQCSLAPQDFSHGSTGFMGYIEKIYSGTAPKPYGKRYIAAMESIDSWHSKSSTKRAAIRGMEHTLMPLVRDIGRMYDELEVEKNTVDAIAENFNRHLLLDYISQELTRLWAEQNALPIHMTQNLIGKIVDHTAVPFIYEKVGQRYQKYMIDEFQDTSQRQWLNFVPLLDEAVAGSDSQSVMLIGDVKQAIYRWRGGDWNILSRGVVEQFAEDADTDELLNTNWRSRANIIDFNNSLIRRIITLDSELLETSLLEQVYDRFEQQIPPSRLSSGGYIQVGGYASDEECFEKTTLAIRDVLNRGYAQRDIAVLVRNKKDGRKIWDELLHQGFRIISQEALQLNVAPPVEIIISTMKYALNREDVISLAILNKNLGRQFDAPFDSPELLDQLAGITPQQALERIIAHFNLGSEPEWIAYVQSIYETVHHFVCENVADLHLFLQWWNETGYKSSIYLPSEQDAITVMTIHKAKGLQFPCVILPFADWEITPVARGTKRTTIWAHTPQEPYSFLGTQPVTYAERLARSHYATQYRLETLYSHIDNINLLYVALTRAEAELYVFHKHEPSANEISSLITSVLGEQDFEQGEKTVPGKKTSLQPEQTILQSFETHESAERIRSSWASQTLFDTGILDSAATPREYGIMMHDIFARIATASDLPRVIETMVLQGEIEHQQGSSLENNISRLISDPRVASWFCDDWQLFSERAIISPGSTSLRRPDRVMTRGDMEEAVVVDYKFGEIEKPNHLRQIGQYMTLLEQMGFRQVTGYVWYIELDKVIRI